jgi:hypothetical protein
MANFIGDITLDGTWQSAYTLTGITVGTAISIQNKGSKAATVFISSSQPSSESVDGVVITVGQQVYIPSSVSGCWIKGGGSCSIQETTVSFNTSSSSSSGGGGGAATIADGADIAQGTTTDTAWSGTGSATIVSLLKATWTALTGNLTVSGKSAIGVAPANPPVSVAGVDGGGLKRHLLTTTGGAPVVTPLQGTPVNKSLTLTVGGTAQTAIASNSSRLGYSFQCPPSQPGFWVYAFGTATQDSPSLWIGPGDYFESPPGAQGTGAISVIGAVTGQKITAREW